MTSYGPGMERLRRNTNAEALRLKNVTEQKVALAEAAKRRDAPSRLDQVRAELAKVNEEIFMMQMGDDYCYTNGKIDPLLNKRTDLSAELYKLEGACK